MERCVTVRNFLQIVYLTLIVLALQSCGSGNNAGPVAANQNVTVEGVVTDLGDLIVIEGDTSIPSGQTSTILIYGQNLNPTLVLTLDGATCVNHDLGPFDNEESDNPILQMYADCPAQSVGNHTFSVTSNGVAVYNATLLAVDPVQLAQKRDAYLASIRPISGPAVDYGSGRLVTVTGNITADRPKIVTPDAPASPLPNGALNYTNPSKFPVRGVVVQLLDTDNNNAVLDTQATDSTGAYTFNVPAGRNLLVQAQSQIAKTRTTGVTTGAQYNMMVRDNSTAKQPFYFLKSLPFTSGPAGTVVPTINATLGFDGSGVLTDATKRLSASFAILDVVYTAVTNIVATNPNITLPDLNIYWSAKNIDINYKNETEKMAGNINTSHFSDSGDYPGVFVLGMLNKDTDEFDSGVVGHEFGHYLQYAASYSDSPGNSHGLGEYKDPSLAYGEGFGTAIGGLLSKSQYYTDSSGKNQAEGSLTDLTQIPSKTALVNDSYVTVKGFYAEQSIGYLLYTLGTTYGFPTFWNALTAMRSGYESATVFSFMNKFIGQGKISSADMLNLAKTVNIKTVDPLGILPPGSAADEQINSIASNGATDLETLYFTVPLSPAVTGTTADFTPVTRGSAPAGGFCMNSNLPGWKDAAGNRVGNVLGASRRFKFTVPSNYDNKTISITLADGNGKPYSISTDFSITVRDGSTGKSMVIPTEGYSWVSGGREYGVQYSLKFKANTTYTLTIRFDEAMYAKGNMCSIVLSLWQLDSI